MSRSAIDKARVRAGLPHRTAPHWGAPIAPGLCLGFRKPSADGTGTWIARSQQGRDQYVYKSLGMVTTENNHEAARLAAAAWHRQLAAGIDQSGTIDTVADVCADYVANLRRNKRAAAADDAARRFERIVDADPLRQVQLRELKQTHLEKWRDRMESGEGKPLPPKKGRPPTVRPCPPVRSNEI